MKKWAYGLLATGVGLCAWVVAAAQGNSLAPNPAEAARETLAKWVETQQIISKERRDWQVGREVLEQRIALVKGEIAAIEQRMAETKAGLGEADSKRYELVRDNQALRDATAGLAVAIGRLENKTRTLLVRLPPAIRDRVEPISQRIPGDPSVATQTLGERFQNVIGVLNEINKFDRDVTVASEILDLPGGGKSEVRTLYLGLGQAYYVNPTGTAAGLGRPASDGWKWEANNAIAPQVAEAIQILKNEKNPAFVGLPVNVQ